MRLTNPWNRFIYRVWAPLYDPVFDRMFAARGRRRALQLLDLNAGERVLLVGVGTGADIPLVPAGVRLLGVDLSPDMLRRAAAKRRGPGDALVVADALRLPLADGAFDAVVLNLVLSVVPDGPACLREALRTLVPGGRAVVFDKFVPDGETPSPLRRALNAVTTLVGTDVTRRLGDMLEGAGGTVTVWEPVLLGGAYQAVLLRRNV